MDFTSISTLIFDFGGGTFDVCLVKAEDGIMQVKDTEGDNWLGGKNLDNAIVDEIHDSNGSGLGMLKFPYKVGIIIGFVSAWGCLPLVFDLSTAEAFNTAYVTTEHPQPEDVETWLEVGAWTWNWMEPLLGTIRYVHN